MTSYYSNQSMSSSHSILRTTFKMAVSIKVNLNLGRSEVTDFDFLYMNKILSKICNVYNKLCLFNQFYINEVKVKLQYFALIINLLDSTSSYIVLVNTFRKKEWTEITKWCDYSSLFYTDKICQNILFAITLVTDFYINYHSLFISGCANCLKNRWLYVWTSL